MSLIEFRSRFEEKLHGFLWEQWSRLGVAGAVAGENRWILDPESLLLFTLEAARSEPRLFDEALDWLLTNGGLLDVQRLRNLSAEDEQYPLGLLGAIASMLAEQESSAKWRRLAGLGVPLVLEEPLFRLRVGAPMPELRAYDLRFKRAGYLRSPFKARALSRPIPMMSAPCVRFRLRAFLGIGIRAEAITYLLTHPESHADDVARAIGYSFPGVRQVLREMSASGLVHARREGREKRYCVEKDRWSGFLEVRFVDPKQLATRMMPSGMEGEKTAFESKARRRVAKELLTRTARPEPATPMEQEARHRTALDLSRPEVVWVNWSRLYRGLSKVVRFIRRPDWDELTEYLRASEFARTASAARDDLEAAERGFHLPSQEGGSLDAHVTALEHALERLVG